MPKTIIVTGASSGIGNALARLLAKSGHQVIATGRNEQALQELQQLFPSQIKIAVGDITTEVGRNNIKAALPADLTGLHLVHNAGIAIPRLLADLTEEELDQQYLLNAKAPILLTKILLPHLKNGGRVLNVSTGLAHYVLPGLSAYGVSKAALYLFKEYCNSELNDEGILFGSAMPGTVDTAAQVRLREQDSNDFPSVGLFQNFHSRGELISPDTVAKFLAWLLLESNDTDFVKDDWNIYDTAHHQFWTMPGEVKQRAKL